MWDSTNTYTYQNLEHHTPKTQTHTKKWLQRTCLTIIYLLVGTSGCYQYLKTEKVLFLQAFNSFLEAHLKRNVFNTQPFCLFFGHWYVGTNGLSSVHLSKLFRKKKKKNVNNYIYKLLHIITTLSKWAE